MPPRYHVWILPLLLLLPAAVHTADTSEPYHRTASQIIAGNILHGPSYLSEPGRKHIHDLLLHIDLQHLRFCRNAFPLIEHTSNEDALPPSAFHNLAKALPVSEKHILVLLRIQKEMLGKMLTARHPHHSLDINAEKKRVRKQSERIFHNYSDIYYTQLIDLIRDVSRVQDSLLPGKCLVTASLDEALTIEASQAETFVIEQLRIIDQNAALLDTHGNENPSP